MEYRYYKPKDFRCLPQEQQDDLKAYRAKRSKGNHGKCLKKKVTFDQQLKGKIASLVSKQVKEKVGAIEMATEAEKDEHREIASIIAGLNHAPVGAKVAVAHAQQHSPDQLAMAAAVLINKIIKRKLGEAPI